MTDSPTPSPVSPELSDETLEMLIDSPGLAIGDEIKRALRELQRRRSREREEAIEECAKVCADMAAERHAVYADSNKESVSNRAYAAYDAYLNAATAIRSLKSNTPRKGEGE